MMSVMFCAFLCGLFIAITAADSNNRLIQDAYGPYAHAPITNRTGTRISRQLLDVKKSVSANKEALQGVALISFHYPKLKKFIPDCTGTYVEAPTGATGKTKFVVTSAHCLYDRAAARFHGKLSQWRVEFGVDDDSRRKAVDIVQCDVADIRISNEWPMTADDNEAVSYDYAVIKLTGDYCDPTRPFTIVDFANSREEQQLQQAGYGSTRHLKLFTQVRERHSAYKSGVFLNKMMIGSTGSGRPGDSGGPIYTHTRDQKKYQLRAVYSGCVSSKSGVQKDAAYAVKIYEDVHANLNNYMLGVDGISASTKECTADNFKLRECWSACVAPKAKQKPTDCFDGGSHSRNFAYPARELKCEADGKLRKYLCGPIKKCSDEKKRSKKCLTDCKNVVKPDLPPKEVCGKHRTNVGHARCNGKKKVGKSFDGYQYFCSDSAAHSAHSTLGNLMRMFKYGYDLGYRDNILNGDQDDDGDHFENVDVLF